MLIRIVSHIVLASKCHATVDDISHWLPSLRHQASGVWTVKSTMMNVLVDAAPIIPRVSTGPPTDAASVLRSSPVSYLGHRFYTRGFSENRVDKWLLTEITIRRVPLFNVRAHWLIIDCGRLSGRISFLHSWNKDGDKKKIDNDKLVWYRHVLPSS